MPGDYFVVATGCGIEKSNKDIVNYEQANPSWDLTYNSGFTLTSAAASMISLPGQGFRVGGDITLNAGANLTIEGKINFTGCYKIKVNAGCSLTITNNSVISGTSQWQGIVNDGGVVTINNGSDITNAVSGVISLSSGILNITGSKFGRNANHIAVSNYNIIQQMNISGNTFGHVIDATTALTCTSFTEYNNLSIPRGVKIFINGLNSNAPINIASNSSWLTEQFSGNNSIFVKATNQRKLTIMLNNVKGFYNKGLETTNCNELSVTGNNVFKLDNLQYGYATSSPSGTGLWFKNSDIATIQDNEIRTWQYGVEYYENLTTTNNTDFSNNKLRYNQYGLVVAPVQNPINYVGTLNTPEYANEIRLVTSCNLFKYNGSGIIGSGKWIDQGTNALSCGNRFKDGQLLNTDHSILWNWTNLLNAVYYCRIMVPSTDDEPKSANPSVIVNIDGTNVSYTSNNKLNPQNTNLNSCTSILNFAPSLSVNDETINSVNIYPNPTSSTVNIKGISGNSVIQIVSIDGKVLMEMKSESNEDTSLNLYELPDGIYIVRIKDNRGVLNNKITKISN